MRYEERDGCGCYWPCLPQLWLACRIPLPSCAPCYLVPECCPPLSCCDHHGDEHEHPGGEHDHHGSEHDHHHEHCECVENYQCAIEECCDPCRKPQCCCCKRDLCGMVCLPRNRGVCKVCLDIVNYEVCCCKLIVKYKIKVIYLTCNGCCACAEKEFTACFADLHLNCCRNVTVKLCGKPILDIGRCHVRAKSIIEICSI